MNRRFFLDIIGILVAVLSIMFTAIFGSSWENRSILYLCSVCCLFSLVWFSIKDFRIQKEQVQDGFLSELVLLSEEETVIKSWSILGRNSVVIGKRNSEEEIDVDLSDTGFSGTVSDVHAVLNYVDKSWYIEDLQSKNGTQIKSFLEDKLYNIRDGQSKLFKKDYIFIGLNKLQIR